MDGPLISVIVPIYNAQLYLEESLNSILAQTYSNLEIILVNDGSTDLGPSICDAYAKKYKQITVIHQKNKGVSSARNAGLDAATGEYVAFVDADDRLVPELYQTLCALLQRQQSCFVACNIYLWRESGVLVNPLPKSFPEEGCVPTGQAYPYLFSQGSYECYSCNKLFLRGLLEGVEALRFDERFGICEDRLFISQLLLRAKSVAFTSFPGYYYRIREKSSQISFRKASHINNLAARKEVLRYLPRDYASYDRAVYLNLLAHCVCDAYEAGREPSYFELQKELRKTAKEFLPDFLTHKACFPVRDHLFLRLACLHCSMTCALYCLLRKHLRLFYPR